MMLRLLVLLSLSCFAKTAPAQDAGEWKKNGINLLAETHYQQALDAFLEADKFHPADAETRTNLGICYFHLHQPELAEAQLFAAYQASVPPPPLNSLYLAKLHQARLDFEKAGIFYKKFLQKTLHDQPWRAAAMDELRRCAVGQHVRRLPPFAAVLSLADLNTASDEFGPLPTYSRQERLYFSAMVDPIGTDIFFTEVQSGDWSPPQPINAFVNSTENETALGFNENGSKLFFLRERVSDSGTIFMDTFQQNPVERTLFFEPFDGPLRPADGDRSLHFFNDSILLFASSRPGGFGGLDLYVSTRSAGIWMPAENLGAVINSAYDETSPFLSRDGRTLYFSTNDADRSMGGLDVLTSSWLDWSGRWSPPLNLGSPVNSASDDEHFVLAPTADRAFFSSDRITGKGGHDLFVALFDAPREEQLSESSPVAFCLVAEGKEMIEAAEGEENSAHFFDKISSFELPVVELPPVGGTFREAAIKQFLLLAQLMKKYPTLDVTLALHADETDEPLTFFLFASQMVTDLLRQERVGGQHLTLLFAGNSFPIAAEGHPDNRRAEIFIQNPTELPFVLYRPQLSATALKARFFQKTLTSLAYRVAVQGEQQKLGDELAKLFELYPEGMVERRMAGDELVFSPSIYLTHAAAEEWRRSLEKDGYKTAKVTAHLRGRELSKEEAAKYIADFPDLQNFIEN